MFGGGFNQPLYDVLRSDTIREVSFALHFNQVTDTMTWPSNLQKLQLGDLFNEWESLSNTRFPETLRQLEVGRGMSKHVASTTWPKSVARLVLGGGFNGTIDGAQLPPRLESLAFGDYFNQTFSGLASEWPPTMNELTFGNSF